MVTMAEKHVEPTNGENWESGDEDWDDGEDDLIVIKTKCLFCDTEFNNPEECYFHCKTAHSFDIALAKANFELDCFSYIKMVNYCRKLSPSPDELMQISPNTWQADDYLTPVILDDGLLQFDIEEHDHEGKASIFEHPCDANLVDLQQRCAAAEFRAANAEEALKSAMSDLAKMKEVAQSFMVGDVANVPVVPSHESIQNLKLGDDDTYFDSYGHFSIHQEMLSDSSRTKFYHDCIYANRDLFKDKLVLDVGCGTGILSMFAATAGAKKVFGIEMSDVFYQAVDIIKENNLETKVQLLKGRMEDIDLPVEKVDIIISEWMGYFLLFESMLDTVLWARDKYLAPNGYVFPNLCNIQIAGLADKSVFDKNVRFWDDVYGFKMNCMKTAVVREACVTSVNASGICTDMCTLITFDLHNTSRRDLEFKSAFQLKINSDTEMTALVGFFDILWKTPSFSSTCSTSPLEMPTHWKQTVFLLEAHIAVQKGDILDGTLCCSKNLKDPRSLKITILLGGKTLKYCMQ